MNSTLPYIGYEEKPSIWCRNPVELSSNKESNNHRQLTYLSINIYFIYLTILHLHWKLWMNTEKAFCLKCHAADFSITGESTVIVTCINLQEVMAECETIICQGKGNNRLAPKTNPKVLDAVLYRAPRLFDWQCPRIVVLINQQGYKIKKGMLECERNEVTALHYNIALRAQFSSKSHTGGSGLDMDLGFHLVEK